MKLVMQSRYGTPKPPIKSRYKKVDELDRGLLQSIAGVGENPLEKRHYNLTAQLLVADQSPEFAATLRRLADNPNPPPTTRLGRPV